MPPDEDKPYDAGDPHDVNVAIRAAKRWDDKRARVLIGILSSEDGRRWVRELLDGCHIGANPFNRDLAAMSFSCGELNIGQRLMADFMNASPELYMQMMAEAKNPADQSDEPKEPTNG